MATTYPEWKRLEDLLEWLRSSGCDRLEADEIIEFGKLYRRAAAELSYHRTHEADPARVLYLNDLVGRCYPYVYAAPRLGRLRISPHVYNDEQDVDRFVEVFKKVAL